ncbi:MAG TPA: 2,3-bisphosphoglycerate-independent phosphoglycerate mutase [Bacteroidia bacterium]|jgi:2,3-bisphosphoglycerate-independent phosphoglycerate mutase|nr:2,3-bisphosphoglycerate-independent phosphoglycerate mutase [Bacteroidia bacterium]
MHTAKKVGLIILDGWGIGDGSKSDAIANAKTPFINNLYKKYAHSNLNTSGENVGLPDGQMGNSEVGHINIGAGRVVYQDLVRISLDIKNGTFQKNEVLLKSLRYANENNKAVHIMGLVSDGGVHSHFSHLEALCDIAAENNCNNVFIHAFTDGRDCDPHSGAGFIARLQTHILKDTAKVASVIGRYYAMDRDKRWERVKVAYDLLVNGTGKKSSNAILAIEESYDEKVSDEFIKPIAITDADGNILPRIKEGDVVICFNYRTDRCREITQALTQQDMPEQGMKTIPLQYITMTNYDEKYKGVNVLYHKDDLKMTLGEVLSLKGKTQIRIAETEKYPHVTFFFSGGREDIFDGEKRIMVPSPKVATYDLKPEMSAVELTDAIVPELRKGEVDFVCMNFANADMVGHTGDYNAIVKAVETVDTCLQKVVETGISKGYSFIIIADHGNADYAINPDGSPNTQHSTNPVPCILVDKDATKVSDGKLADIAPTILKLMGIQQPAEMTGISLV